MKTLEKSLALLEAVAAAPDGTGVRELARAVKMNTTTVHGILATFTRCGYMTADGGTYRLGLKSFLLGGSGNRFETLWNQARPYLERLKNETGHTTACSIMKDGAVHSLGVVCPQSGVAVMMQPGPVDHAHTTATGKYLLAQLPEPELKNYLKRHPLKKTTEKSLCLRADLITELEHIRADGFAKAVDESLPGVSALAEGVYDNNGKAVAAVGITFPTSIAPNAAARNILLRWLGICARNIEKGIR